MAIATVVATKVESTSGNNASAAVSATAGNALIVGGAAFQGTTWAVTRTGDTYTQDTQGSPGNNSDIGICSAPNVAGGSVTMTITVTSANGVSGFAAEVSGLPTSAIRDATSPSVNSGSSTTPASNALTNATADAIYFSAVGSDQGSNTAITSTGSGWSTTIGGTTMTEPDGTTHQAAGLAFLIVSSAASRTETWTAANAAWSCGIAVYKAAAGAAATSLVMPHNPLAAMIGR